MKILIHFDGGAGVGLGHMSRCVALAMQMQRAGHKVIILVDPSLRLSSFATSQGLDALEVPINASLIGNLADHIGADCLIVDSYKWCSKDFDAVKGKWLVIAFDDDASRELPVDALINGSLAADTLEYKTSSNTALWIGPHYQIVRDFFAALPPREICGVVRRVIAMVGGDDSHKLLPKMQDLFDGLAARNGFIVDIICGPFASRLGIHETKYVNILINPPDLSQRMALADLAVSASGQTLYELSRCGTPTIAFCATSNQVHNLAAFSSANAVLDAGIVTNPNLIRNISVAVQQLVDDKCLRVSMSKVGQTLIDGFGAQRLVVAIEEMLAKAKIYQFARV
jgi:spore coat polysaccharide biosynthesis predicted glycosyltransferase SpsG